MSNLEAISLKHLDEDERLELLADAEWGDSDHQEELGVEFVAIQPEEPRRWQRAVLVVFKRISDGKLFGAHYDEALTEMQESECYDTELREIEVREVVTREYKFKKEQP